MGESSMKIEADQRLFWFLKEGVSLDLSNPSALDMYVQQVATHGRSTDVKKLLKTVEPDLLAQALARLKRFLPPEVKVFWEAFVASHP